MSKFTNKGLLAFIISMLGILVLLITILMIIKKKEKFENPSRDLVFSKTLNFSVDKKKKDLQLQVAY